MPENRDAEGHFRPGVSGNPGGRPRKVRDLQDAIEAAHTPSKILAVLEKLHDLALAGDVGAAKAYLDRVAGPVPRQPKEMIDLSTAPDAVLDWIEGLP